MVFEADFFIEYPDSWSLKDRFTPVALRCSSPLEKGARDVATIMIFRFKGVDQPKQYFKRSVSKLHSRFSQFELLETLDILHKSINWFKVKFLAGGDSPQTRELHEHHMHLAPERSYVIETKCRNVDYDLYAKDIDAIVKSFRLIEVKQALALETVTSV